MNELPREAAYLIYDRSVNHVVFVGSSIDVGRRLDWWQRPGGHYAATERFAGVLLDSRRTAPNLTWLAEGFDAGIRSP